MGPTRPTSRLGFEIAIICALTIEADAVEALFDQYWEDKHSFGKVPGDSNAYTTGTIGRHNVVLAHMPGMGKAKAAAVAAHCQTSFPNIKLALVVGVCGAVPFPNTDTEIILGDIIISNGAVQYDFGHQLPESFIRKNTLLESLSRPNLEIRTLLGKLEGRRSRMSLRTKILNHLEELQKEPDLQAQYPGPAHDKLYKASYRHLEDGKTCEECGCSGELISRHRLQQEDIQPAVHFGLIASGDTVMKFGEARDKLAAQESIIGFEMEGSGVWNIFPCIVIKGACDYADSHKAKRWQQYAAATAAACAKAFLEFWEPSAQGQTVEKTTTKFLVPYPSNPDFIGRSDILQQLKDKLGYMEQDAATSFSRASLFGLGGVGKTQIALAFIYWLQETHPTISILWVHASNPDRFRQSYMSIAEEYQIPGYTDSKTDILLLVKEWLERKDSGPWLMVLDNADDMQLFFGSPIAASYSAGLSEAEPSCLSDYIPECRHGSLLVTTRNKQLGVRLAKSRQPVEVSCMNKDESEQLLLATIGTHGTIKATTAELSLLSSQLEHLPLALVQAAAFIQETCITVAKYLQLLRKSDNNVVHLLSKEFETVGRDSSNPQAVAQTWILSFQQIRQQHFLGSELLSFMSLLDRQDIPAQFLSCYIDQRENEEPISELELTEALGILKAFSFVTEDNNGSYNMHRLIQLVTHKWLTSSGTCDHFRKLALMVVSNLYPDGTYETRTTCATYLSHANAVLQSCKFSSGDEAEAKASLLHCMASYLRFEGQCGDAEPLDMEGMCIRRELFGRDHPSTLKSMGNLASTLSDQGRWEEAEKLEVQVMEMSKIKLGADHPSTLKSMSHLASILCNQGQCEEAEKLNLQVMETYQIKLGADHPDTLECMSDLAVILCDQGRQEEAEKLNLQVLETRRRKLGADHPDTLTSIGNLASTYWNQRRFKEAEQLELQVIEMRKIKLGADHPETLTSIGNLASTLQDEGRWEEAEKLELQVMEARKIKLGADHPYTLTSMSNLALTYWNQGRFKEAEQLELQVMEIRKIKLGADHPDTLHSMGNLASTYWNQGRLKEAEQLELQVIEIRKMKFGADHPTTLTSINNLASTLRDQGRWEEAEKLEVQVMEISKIKLGADHPNTLLSMHNLASILQKQGRWEEAEKLEVQLIETYMTKLGADHPDTLSGISSLASTYWSQGRLKEAEQLEVQVMEIRKTNLGADHPDTLLSMHNLASTLQTQGRWEEAEKLHLQVLETWKIKLGADHPSTMKSMARLACTWNSLGKETEAIDLMQTCIRLRKIKLGVDHPDTQSSVLELDSWQNN